MTSTKILPISQREAIQAQLTSVRQSIANKRVVSATDDDGCASEAQRFCVKQRPWLVEVARRTLQKRGLKEHAEDIAHEVFKKLGEIPNDVWSEKQNKKAYVARVIINRANDFSCQDHDFEPLTDNSLTSTPTEAMEAAILVEELYKQMSTVEQQLLDLMFQGYSGAEIAKRLGITHTTVRKRISRLKQKLHSASYTQNNVVIEGRKETHPKFETLDDLDNVEIQTQLPVIEPNVQRDLENREFLKAIRLKTAQLSSRERRLFELLAEGKSLIE